MSWFGSTKGGSFTSVFKSGLIQTAGPRAPIRAAGFHSLRPAYRAAHHGQPTGNFQFLSLAGTTLFEFEEVAAVRRVTQLHADVRVPDRTACHSLTDDPTLHPYDLSFLCHMIGHIGVVWVRNYTLSVLKS